MLTLREFRPDDAASILSWINNERELRMWSADRFGDYPVSPENLVDHYKKCSSSGTFFPLTAADEHGNVLGHLILRYTDENKNEVRFGFVIVDRSARGRGVGRAMLELAKSYAIDVLHAEKLSLGVFKNNLSARKCYKAAGFCELDEGGETYNVFGEKWKCIEICISLT
ncbi:MAG: GNAT family N-acetyltransferase [Ruminococcus sp.]|uniref:GNAT family N-acetyltransferase n=1 Tax=Ruminococcus sp. TaxID=41978 RepID=UPI0025D709AD|nr:GNAT family protein [Ruminococcus sp.]MCR5599246.1 GNAT family N-acetyltransferase [Ruminococcus sp.]